MIKIEESFENILFVYTVFRFLDEMRWWDKNGNEMEEYKDSTMW